MGRPLIVALFLALVIALPARAIDMEDVFRMVDASVDEEVILKAIDADGESLVIYPEDLITLSDMGASDWFLKELIERSTGRRTRIDRETRYRVIEPSYSYVRLGVIYDPFDYYFAHWPYYYAYVSPFSFCWNWWYYGGPYHAVWCHPYSYRTIYYRDAWGHRSVWKRGGHRDHERHRYHVPSYASPKEERQRVLYHRDARPALVSAEGRRIDEGTRPLRPVRDDKPIRSRLEPRPAPGERERPSGTDWGRPERRSERPEGQVVRPERRGDRERPSAPALKPERSPAKESAPSRSITPAPSRPPSRGSAPARPSPSQPRSGNSGSRSGSSPARPSR